MTHVVRTTHIQALITNALRLAETVDGVAGGYGAGDKVRVDGSYRVDGGPVAVPPEHILGKAAADLRHAAEELEAERLSCLGWDQA